MTRLRYYVAVAVTTACLLYAFGRTGWVAWQVHFGIEGWRPAWWDLVLMVFAFLNGIIGLLELSRHAVRRVY